VQEYIIVLQRENWWQQLSSCTIFSQPTMQLCIFHSLSQPRSILIQQIAPPLSLTASCALVQLPATLQTSSAVVQLYHFLPASNVTVQPFHYFPLIIPAAQHSSKPAYSAVGVAALASTTIPFSINQLRSFTDVPSFSPSQQCSRSVTMTSYVTN